MRYLLLPILAVLFLFPFETRGEIRPRDSFLQKERDIEPKPGLLMPSNGKWFSIKLERVLEENPKDLNGALLSNIYQVVHSALVCSPKGGGGCRIIMSALMTYKNKDNFVFGASIQSIDEDRYVRWTLTCDLKEEEELCDTYIEGSDLTKEILSNNGLSNYVSAVSGSVTSIILKRQESSGE